MDYLPNSQFTWFLSWVKGLGIFSLKLVKNVKIGGIVVTKCRDLCGLWALTKVVLFLKKFVILRNIFVLYYKFHSLAVAKVVKIGGIVLEKCRELRDLCLTEVVRQIL